MNTIAFLSLIAGAIAFLFWTFLMFQTLITLRKRAVLRTGKSFPGPFDSLQEINIWLRDPQYVKVRQQLLVLTVLVLGFSILTAICTTPQG